jgi:hypothetical protein
MLKVPRYCPQGEFCSMAPIKEALPSSTHKVFLTEVPGEDLHRHKDQLLALLETICHSPIFQNSPRSCEFIRHVVVRSLSGDVDELKERLIGMLLLGRDASYDTSTDSGVRVRANDVRKRLAKFNESNSAEQEFSIALPPGSYVPRFFRTSPPEQVVAVPPGIVPQAYDPPVSIVPTELNDLEQDAPLPPLLMAPSQLSLFQLAVPTLVAIFVCIICMRWQVSQEHVYTNFWQQILQGDQALLYLTPSHAAGKQGLVAIQELNEAAPLLDLAGQFHRQFTVMSAPTPVSATSTMILHVGLDATSDMHSRADTHEVTERFFLANSANDRVILDRKDPNHAVSRHAALLTIINGPQRSIYIDGTDDDAIRSVVNRICDESTFPGSLADSFHPGTITQAIFPSEAYAKAILDRQPMTRGLAALEFMP